MFHLIIPRDSTMNFQSLSISINSAFCTRNYSIFKLICRCNELQLEIHLSILDTISVHSELDCLESSYSQIFFKEFDDLISWSNVPYSIFQISLDCFNVLTFWQVKGRFEETLHVMRGFVLTLYATKTCYSQNLFAVSKRLLKYESSTKSKWFIILRFDTIFVWTFETRLTDLHSRK